MENDRLRREHKASTSLHGFFQQSIEFIQCLAGFPLPSQHTEYTVALDLTKFFRQAQGEHSELFFKEFKEPIVGLGKLSFLQPLPDTLLQACRLTLLEMVLCRCL